MVQVRLFSLEAFPGTRPGGFTTPDLACAVRPPIGLDQTNVVTEY